MPFALASAVLQIKAAIRIPDFRPRAEVRKARIPKRTAERKNGTRCGLTEYAVHCRKPAERIPTVGNALRINGIFRKQFRKFFLKNPAPAAIKPADRVGVASPGAIGTVRR